MELIKPMLKVDDLIIHMQEKGIKFNLFTTSEAKVYLHNNNNYFKLSSYRKNFIKNIEDKYINLDFAYLIELARIDVEIMHLLFNMCLDIEHFLKVELIKMVETKEENGYSVVSDFIMFHIDIPKKIEDNGKNPYCQGLIKKYKNNMPIWAFMEVISFGDLIKFTDFISQRFKWKPIVDLLTLDRVRQIRNATAHGNCIIYDLTPVKDDRGNYPCKNPVYITQFVRNCGIGVSSMNKKLSNPRLSQIVHLLFTYNKIVQSSKTRNIRINEIKHLINNRMIEHVEYYRNNDLLISTYNFFKKIANNFN